MERVDLRSKIIPTKIDNVDEKQKAGNEEFDTTDLIYLDSKEEQFCRSEDGIARKVSATDYAKMNNVYLIHIYETARDSSTACVWLRTATDTKNVSFIYCSGECYNEFVAYRDAGIVPTLHYQLNGIEKNDIKHVTDKYGETIYHTLQIGEYPKTKVDENLSYRLEEMYNEGKLNKGLICTGRWYSADGFKGEFKNEYLGKHNPEFEYEGNRYVRVVSITNADNNRYSDGTLTGESGNVRWVKVEPISFIIRNWDDMPKEINENGSGKAEYFDLRAEEVLISNIPFYPFDADNNNTMWQNSTIRGFLNGVDVRNIHENGNLEFPAPRGGDFHDRCNFLNEAFNLSREPMIEYAIPDSEMEIPENAFNGCLTLEKLVIHKNVKSIGKSAFDGVDMKYAYWNKDDELIISQKMPENKEECIDLINLDEMKKVFDEFGYNVLVHRERLKDIIKFAELLNKSNFKVPFEYANALVKKGIVDDFFKNTDFRFFKNEIPQIYDMLLKQPYEERVDFFKFARNLGCFSTEKMLDKKGKETEIILAQKATSTVAQLLKSDDMKLRKLS